jgi:hypothetical protein
MTHLRIHPSIRRKAPYSRSEIFDKWREKITEHNTSGTEGHLKLLMKVSTFHPNLSTFQTLTIRSDCKFSFNLQSLIFSTCQKESALSDLTHNFNSCIIANSFTLYWIEISFMDTVKAHGLWQAHFVLSISANILSTCVHCTELYTNNLIELVWPAWVRKIRFSQLCVYIHLCCVFIVTSGTQTLLCPVSQLYRWTVARLYMFRLYTLCTNSDLSNPAVDNLNQWFIDSCLKLGLRLYCCTVTLYSSLCIHII